MVRPNMVGIGLRVAILGCGTISHQHVAAFRSNHLSIITALIDKQLSKTRSVRSGQPEPKVFSSLDDALRWNEFDAVDIMLPHDVHEAAAVQCLRAGKHVLLEKPLAHNIDAARRILDEARKARTADPRLVFMVAENASYWPEVVKAEELIADGCIGDVHMAKSHYWESKAQSPFAMFDTDSWRYSVERVGGGILMDGCSHWIRPLRVWMGDIDEVVGITSRDPIKSMQGESLVRALIRFKSGKFGQMGGTVSTAPMSNQPFFHIFGTKGEITIDGDFDGGMTLFNHEHPRGLKLGSHGGFMASYKPEIDDFLSAIIHKTPLKASAEQALGELQTAQAIYRSMDTKRWEKIDSF